MEKAVLCDLENLGLTVVPQFKYPKQIMEKDGNV